MNLDRRAERSVSLAQLPLYRSCTRQLHLVHLGDADDLDVEVGLEVAAVVLVAHELEQLGLERRDVVEGACRS